MLLLVATILLASSQIFLRNFLGTGISWADPLLRLLVLWLSLMGAMAATRDNNHIRIDLLSRYLPSTFKRLSQKVTDLFAAIVCILLAWHSARFVYLEWQDASVLFSSVPAWLGELIMPFGFAVMALRFALSVFLGRYEKKEEV